MKMKKLISLATTVFILASTAINAIPVNAEEKIIEKGFDLVYDVANSSATTRAIKIYTKGENSKVNNFTMQSTLSPTTDITWSGLVSGIEVSDCQSSVAPTVMYMDGMLNATAFSSNPTVPLYSGDYLGTIVIPVKDENSTFTMTVTSIKIVGDVETIDNNTGTKDTLEVPAFATTPVVPEPPVDTRSNFEVADAKKIGRYDADKTSVPVDAWLAEIDYSAVKLAEGASLAWKVNVSDETIDVADDTTVSGEASVFYGLAIAGRADQLDTITTVQLIAE